MKECKKNRLPKTSPNVIIKKSKNNRKKRCPKCKKLRPKERTPKVIDGQKVCQFCWRRSEYGLVEEVMEA
jgi:hypothetical protein